MSDFLTNFTKEKYDGKKQGEATEDNASDVSDEMPQKTQEAVFEQPVTKEEIQDDDNQPNTAEPVDEQPSRSRRNQQATANVSRFQTEETEFDPTYKKKQQRKYLFIGLGSALALILAIFTYYQLSYVKVPDFTSKEIAEVRTWGSESGVKIEVAQEYNFEEEINHVITQGVKADKKIRKGKILNVTASLGPDPEEKITLPNFSTLTKTEAADWILEEKAENVTLIENYDDSIKKGVFIKQEFASKELKAEDYKRKDRLMVYYSKGKEVFEKNIEVIDFTGKPLAEVEEWAKKNEVKIKIVKDFSNTVADGVTISQEIAKGTKIGKDEVLTIHLSKGKAIEIPDYSQYTMEEATTIETKIPVVIKSLYSDYVAYGQFISQSVEAGKQFNETDTIPPVTVVYSQGKPYMKDLRGSVSEGDLPKLFFDEYESKGANIYYSIYYVDSAEPKGTVVEMSTYGQFIPLESTIWIGISLGNLTTSLPDVPDTPDPELQGLSDTGAETDVSVEATP